jgi:hypothetical protein
VAEKSGSDERGKGGKGADVADAVDPTTGST